MSNFEPGEQAEITPDFLKWYDCELLNLWSHCQCGHCWNVYVPAMFDDELFVVNEIFLRKKKKPGDEDEDYIPPEVRDLFKEPELTDASFEFIGE